MSVFWKGDVPLGGDGAEYGCDGDFAHGHIKVGYWRDREVFIAEVDRRIAEMREAMIAETEGMMADVWANGTQS
jgi:hypothetical protein